MLPKLCVVVAVATLLSGSLYAGPGKSQRRDAAGKENSKHTKSSGPAATIDIAAVLGEYQHVVREYVKQSPERSLLIAGVVGLIIGAVWRRR